MRWGTVESIQPKNTADQRQGALHAVAEIGGEVFRFEKSLDSLLRSERLCSVRTRYDLEQLGGKKLEKAFEDLVLLAPVARPEKILCVGLNYTDHAEEVGAELPKYPTIFTKYANALVGPQDDICMPTVSEKVDWEAELAVVMGRSCRNVTEGNALEYVLGYTIVNDVSVRDWQGRTSEWFQGKNWDSMTPWGPCVVTPDCIDPQSGLEISCTVNGEQRQLGNTANMIFSTAQVISYLSTFMTLAPGDVVALGTPAGVGLSIRPRKWLAPGQKMVTVVEEIGQLENMCVETNT